MFQLSCKNNTTTTSELVIDVIKLLVPIQKQSVKINYLKEISRDLPFPRGVSKERPIFTFRDAARSPVSSLRKPGIGAESHILRPTRSLPDRCNFKSAASHSDGLLGNFPSVNECFVDPFPNRDEYDPHVTVPHQTQTTTDTILTLWKVRYAILRLM